MTLVVDASVAFCWFTREAGSAQANALIRSKEELIAPSLLCVEVANTAWKKLRNKEMTADQALAATVEIRRFILEIAPVETLTRDALDIASQINHSLYDCVYLALARRREARFITLDDVFLRALADTTFEKMALHLADWRPA
ncbi:MAG TPA: type II toxin-antitoxin system VapC family toxin [Rhodoblastus sp.]|nr:type II toxin-antitoxin system VapC family toxin [Rhodoblastus sp.]